MKRKIVLFLVVLLVLSAPTAVFAQDDRPTLTFPVQQEEEPATVAGDNVIINTWAAITGVVMAFLAGGVVGIAGIGVLMNRLKNDQATLNAIEGLVTSAPPSVVEILQEIVRTGRVTLDVIDTVSDGQPNIVAEDGAGLSGIKLTVDLLPQQAEIRFDQIPH